MSRPRKKTAEEREWTRTINRLKFSTAALKGLRVHRTSLSSDELSLIVVNLAWCARFATSKQRDEMYAVCKRMWRLESEWLKRLFYPAEQQERLELGESHERT